MRLTLPKRPSYLAAGLAIAACVLAASSHRSLAQEVWPGTSWATSTPSGAGMNGTLLTQGVDYAKAYGGSGMVVRGGKRVRYWGDQAKVRHLLSATKTIGSILLGLGIGDGKASLAQPIQPIVPDFRVPPIPSGNQAEAFLPTVTVEHLARHLSGLDKPGGFGALLLPTGTGWLYSDGGANWVADYLTQLYQQDLAMLLRARVLDHLQISVTDLTWRDNAYRPRTYGTIPRREFGAGVSANVNALARLGLLLLRDGRWKDQRLLPEGFVGAMAKPALSARLVKRYDAAASVDAEAPQHYGLLAWNNADGWLQGVPTDAFWAWGKGEHLIVVIPSLDLVVVRTGGGMGSTAFGQIQSIQPLLGPIARSVRRTNAAPVVHAGIDQSRLGPGMVTLDGSVQEDGLPGTSRMTIGWRQVSGPAPVTIHKPGRLATHVDLPVAGTYVMELLAGDGLLTAADTVTITVE